MFPLVDARGRASTPAGESGPPPVRPPGVGSPWAGRDHHLGPDTDPARETTTGIPRLPGRVTSLRGETRHQGDTRLDHVTRHPRSSALVPAVDHVTNASPRPLVEGGSPGGAARPRAGEAGLGTGPRGGGGGGRGRAWTDEAEGDPTDSGPDPGSPHPVETGSGRRLGAEKCLYLLAVIDPGIPGTPEEDPRIQGTRVVGDPGIGEASPETHEAGVGSHPADTGAENLRARTGEVDTDPEDLHGIAGMSRLHAGESHRDTARAPEVAAAAESGGTAVENHTGAVSHRARTTQDGAGMGGTLPASSTAGVNHLGEHRRVSPGTSDHLPRNNNLTNTHSTRTYTTQIREG